MAVTLPHFGAPFRLNADGTPFVVQQGSDEEVAASIHNIIVFPKGAKLGDPSFGAIAPLFDAVPVDWTDVIAAVEKFEPRANVAAVESALSTIVPGEINSDLLVEALSQPNTY